MRRRPRGLRWLLPAVGCVALGIWMLSPDGSVPAALTGYATVVDGDTLRLRDWRVRLDGIDAPELAQTCIDGAGATWPCGEVARQRLGEIIAGRELTCRGRERDRYGRQVAICTAGDDDLADRLAGEGMAVPDGRYAAAARDAQAARRGIWAGRFDQPAAWRRASASDDPAGAAPNRLSALADWVENVFFR